MAIKRYNKMKIDANTLRRIKSSASIVDVIGYFYELSRKGKDYQCLCPFHNDHHLGSFIIDERRNTYCCFACGAHGDSIEFLMRHENLTFFEAVAWLGKKYGIDVEGSERFDPTPARPHRPALSYPMLTLPIDMVKARLDTRDDTFCNWVRSLPWNDEQKERVESVLRSYGVGHARQGHTIFWQIDESAQVRTGKFMLYKPDGHRDKESPHNFTWAHTLLHKAHRINLDTVDVKTTLFGLHLLPFHPDAAINIVESEKTAILAAIMWGHPEKWVWMACGGLSMLHQRRLYPMIEQKREIFLYPDRDGVAAWKQQAIIIGYRKLHVCDKYVTDYWSDSDGPKADLGDIIVRSLTSGLAITKTDPPGTPHKTYADVALKQLIKTNPAVGALVDKLNLKPIEAFSYGPEN